MSDFVTPRGSHEPGNVRGECKTAQIRTDADLATVRDGLFDVDDAHSRTESSFAHYALDRIARELEDARSALRYIEQRYGRLDGVGWERVL